MNYSSIKVKQYKLFDEAVLTDIKRVNVIIGKNNSGKSSLIDVVGAAYDGNQCKQIKQEVGEVICGTKISEPMVQATFNGHTGINRWNFQNYCHEVVGKEIEFNILPSSGQYNKERIKTEINSSDPIINELKNYWNMGLRLVEESLEKVCFHRLRAERNIVPEVSSLIGLSETGEGASNLIRKITLESGYDESIVEVILLDALNMIIYPEEEFEEIRVQQVNNDNDEMWEVFLKEKGKKRIPLSKMGSGIKTIILVLLNLLVIPQLSSQGKNKYVYAFEEIENNLHPALQRRIFEYIYDYAIEKDIIIYLTTHSHVAINTFYDKEQASIYHIVKSDGKATLNRIESYLDKAEILSDLDVKASDILQSNGIIWVEGPSDRIYIKRWLELYTDNEFKEGRHYQFLYYGGRILSHYEAKEETDLISILTTNRNAAIIIDSDKKNQQASLNKTKKRIIGQFEHLGMFCWVTKGKEIENYIPAGAIREMVGNPRAKQCRQYELFPDYIKRYSKEFDKGKVPFANKIAPLLTKDNCDQVLDLQRQIKELYKCIERWNE